MTPKLWNLLESVFQGALDRDPRERDEYLRQACGGDEALRREVEKLLAAHEEHSFLEPWAAAAARRVLGKTGGLEEGQRLGPYRIEKHLASGGMGMVYRAHDTRLDRTVAIKMLLSAPLGDEIRIRLKREAQAIARLQHPNICALYDIGEEKGREYLVMEYLEGQTLATRLRGGALPLRLAIEYAIAVAAALEHLHRRNITHRDLKPGNIMIARTGLKLLDFGLATWLKSAEPTPWMPGENVTTRSFELTRPGALMGTPPYMAPEQLRGEHTDSRTDMFAFGLLLYEMLAGRRAFDQDERQALMRAILGGQPPPLSGLRPEIKPALLRVVELCLAKDPDERWQNAGDLKRELAWILSGDSSAPAPLTRRRMATWGAVAFGGAVATGWYGNRLSHPTPAERSVRTYLYPPDGEQFTPGSGLALSPDGRRVAYVTTSTDGTEMLWIRTLEDRDGRPLRGTGGARMPFWSPDGRYVAFFAEQRLKKTDASGGPIEVICEAPLPMGGTWGPADTILLVPFGFSGVHRVSAKGGELVSVTKLDRTHEDYQHYWPRFLTDGRHFLFTSYSQSRGMTLQLGSLDSAEVKSLGPFGRAVFQSGRLYFTDQGALKWQPFDLGRLELTGKPQLVANLESILSFDGAANGNLVYQPSNIAGTRELAWFDRTGRTVSAPFEPDFYEGVSLSPDGRTAAVVIPDAGVPHIWLCDTASGSRRRFVTHAAFPVWSPDGRRIVYTSHVSGPGTVCARSSDGSGTEEVLLKGLTDEATTSWSPDGRSICYVEHTREPEGFAIWLLPSSGDHKPTPFLIPSKGFITQGAFSPNGKWLAYSSDQHVSVDISVIRFPDKSGEIRVSHDGGGYPLWRSDGRELFYIDAKGRLVAVGVVPRGSDLVFGDAQPLFTLEIGRWTFSYATLDGRRFLAIRSRPTRGPWPLVAIFHAAGSAL